ncbi:uncharacterized protein [Littorina saxatilis]|uniref:uncharacterized protein n=1 Tax=Littorina saxatilis TaxID=31220 RepID=UPI0038B4553E
MIACRNNMQDQSPRIQQNDENIYQGMPTMRVFLESDWIRKLLVIASSLVLQHGADVNAQTSKGDTACHLAAYRGHLEAVQVLLAAGADVDVTNTHFRTPYDDAVREGHVTILPYLEGSEKIEIESESIPNSSVRPPPHHYSRTSGHGVMGSAGHVGSRPCDGRRDSCDCTSNQSLSRESSYEDCGGQGIMNVVDFVDRLRSRDHHDLSYTDTLFPSSHPSLATSTFPPSRLSSGMDFGLANTRDLDFSTGGDYGFTAGGDLDYSKTGVDCGFKPSRDMVYPKAGGGGSSFAAGAEFSSPNGAEKRPYPYPTRYSERVAFPASGNPSFTASSLPFTYSDPGSNDLSLTSDRSSAQKNLISRLNIPA